MQNEDMIYNLLKSGATADDISKMLNDAQKKIDKEIEEAKKAEAENKAREEAITEARADLIDALEWFYIALGVAPDEEDTKAWDSFHRMIENTILFLEKSIRNTKISVKSCSSDEAKDELDKIMKKYANNPFFSKNIFDWF